MRSGPRLTRRDVHDADAFDPSPRARADRGGDGPSGPGTWRPPCASARLTPRRSAGLRDETSREFIEAGFYRILQPRRFGGYEFDLPTFTRVAIEMHFGLLPHGVDPDDPRAGSTPQVR